MKLKTRLRILGLRYHRWLVWLAAIALLAFGLSGLTHPLMLWTGPMPAAFHPPRAAIEASHVAAVPHIITRHAISAPLQVRLIPSGGEVLVQVTERLDQPRRYFDPATGAELHGHDMRHAILLARHYSGLEEAEIAAVDFQTDFDNAYPWVNRLLPVYRIQFATPDARTLYIHTEFGALANITNQWKTALQTLFGVLHTWNFLDDAETLRVAAMAVLLLSLLAMTLTGMVLVITLSARKQARAGRRWHRRMAYILWLPLLGFMASGSYHLLQYSYGENTRGMRLAMPLPLHDVADSTQPEAHFRTGGMLLEQSGQWVQRYAGIPFNSISLVQGEGGVLLWRLAVPQGTAIPSANARFDGVVAERKPLYVNASTGAEVQMDDSRMAIFVAGWYEAGQQPAAVSEVTRFSPEYDFRNKRLPVWKLDYDTGQTLFIDPAGGVLVDRIGTPERIEGYVFSHVHKWNFLADLTHRLFRDMLVVLVIGAAIIMAIVGLRLRLRP